MIINNLKVILFSLIKLMYVFNKISCSFLFKNEAYLFTQAVLVLNQ